MLVNFMSSKYVAKIECDKPQRDEFCIESLVEDGGGASKKGFIVDTFIRPPVNVRIYFKEAIKLEKILINAKVNSQVSNGFVISTSIEGQAAAEFRQISRLTNETNKTCFQYEFRRRTPRDEANNSTVNLQYFATSYLPYLNRVNAINILITRTQSSTSPCLRSVQVIGSLADEHVVVVSSELEQAAATKTTEKQPNHPVSDDVPSEFLDELTHELMRLPILLPSGHRIDRSSLDKYLHEQKQANHDQFNGVDPFTQIEFSAVYKPVIDDTLKGRIDRFLLDKGHVRTEQRQMKRRLSGEASTTQQPPAKKQSSRQPDTTLHLISCSCCLNKHTFLNSYEISTCKHTYCRHCIHQLKDFCIICKKKFKTSEVTNLTKSIL